MQHYVGLIDKTIGVMKKITLGMACAGLLSAGIATGYIVSKGKIAEENRKIVEYLFADGLTAAAVGALCYYRLSRALRQQDE